jgi:isocitrate lyase
MRGTLQGEAPYQDATAQKLFETLDLCANTGGHSRTYGALDPVQAATMAPKLTSIYVSGWQCSSTSSSSNEPGPDFADYPYDTVPKKVDQLFKALKHHDRRAFSSGQDVDYLTPIVADGDTGHGGLTAVMKLTQLMVEAGAAGVHFEDQSVFGVVICLRLGVLAARRSRRWRRRRHGVAATASARRSRARVRDTPSTRPRGSTIFNAGPPARRSAATWAARS